MTQVAVVAMGHSADSFFRSAERSGNTRYMFDEVWTVNGFAHIFRCDRAFHMDDIRVQYMRGKNGNHKIGHLVEWIRRSDVPVYTSRALPTEPNLKGIEDAEAVLAVVPKTLPDGKPNREYFLAQRWVETLKVEKELIEGGGFENLKAYPLEEVINKFRVHPYFTNTVAYAMALAGLEGHNQTVYGADFHYPEGHQSTWVEKGRGCCEFWSGVLAGRGLDVNITKSSTLFDASEPENQLYGYDGLDVEGALGDDGHVHLRFKDKPLPPAVAVEAKYFKGPPELLGRYLQEQGLDGKSKAA